MRRVKFENGHFYHIYNRGVDKRKVFLDEKDYIRFIFALRILNRFDPIDSLYKLKHSQASKTLASVLDASLSPLVNIICYNLLPNHFHFMVKQIQDNGISKFMLKLGQSHTMYFNSKNNRTGSLFQGTYKAIEIKSDSYLQYLSCYIHGNAEIHGIAKAKDWPWSSYPDYIGARNGTLCDKNIILKEFENIAEYIILTKQIILESKSRKDEIRQYFLE